jgi:DNA-binding NtrC family response regulator
MAQADGQEVLILDGDEKVQRGMTQMLSAAGLVPTVLSDAGRARELVREKYFPVVVIDLDTPAPGAGLELVRLVKQTAPNTTVIVLASRKVFEAAVEAFRAGASDVVVKSPDQVEYLKQRVVASSTETQARDQTGQVLGEVLEVHEEFLKRLMEYSRRAAEFEEQKGGGSQSSAEYELQCGVLLVEPFEDGWLAGSLGELLKARGGYTLRVVGSGGEGIDVATAGRIQIALVAESLPDLPGKMVIRAIKGAAPETLTILYSRPGARPGKAEVVEGSKLIPLLPEFSEGRQMFERVDELREAFRRKSRERRYLATFRQENYELLRRYAEMKAKLQKLK